MGSLIRRHNGVYYGVFTVRGKRVWRSTRMRTEEDAAKAYLELCREYESWRGLTVLGFRDELVNLIEGKLAKSTIRLYVQALTRFAELRGNLKIDSLTPYDVERFNSDRLKVVSATKVSIDFRVLKAAFNRAVRYEMMEKNPCLTCERPMISQKTPRFLSREEAVLLLAVADDPQMRGVILLALCTAMRLGEIVHLRWSDVDFKTGVIRLRNHDDFKLKTRKERSVPLNRLALSILQAQPQFSDFLFPGKDGRPYSNGWVSRRFKRYVRKAALPGDLHFHSLRHTGASWLVQSSVPITFVKEILGHSNLSTTMAYAHATTEHLRHSVFEIDRLLGSGKEIGGIPMDSS